MVLPQEQRGAAHGGRYDGDLPTACRLHESGATSLRRIGDGWTNGRAGSEGRGDTHRQNATRWRRQALTSTLLDGRVGTPPTPCRLLQRTGGQFGRVDYKVIALNAVRHFKHLNHFPRLIDAAHRLSFTHSSRMRTSDDFLSVFLVGN